MEPKFSERQFELCFNNEFINRYRQLFSIFSAPYVPSQNEEGDIGYDVRYDLIMGKSAISLMLQFKTSHFVRRRLQNNAHIYDCYHGSYFRFPLMKKYVTDQHDIMVNLSNMGEHIFYCAPNFYMMSELHSLFWTNNVTQNSRLFNPSEIGLLPDNRQHHVSYDPLGLRGFFHSKNKKEVKILEWNKIIPTLKSNIITEAYLFDLKKILIKTFEDRYHKFKKIPEKFNSISIFHQISYMLFMYIDVVWILIPDDQRIKQ